MTIRFRIAATLRCVSILIAISIFEYLYSPFPKRPLNAPPARFVFVLFMVLAGWLMWNEDLFWRLFGKKPEQA